MAVTYRFLTEAQQATLAKTKAFEYEYNHYVASLEATADPANADLAKQITVLEQAVPLAQAEFDAKLAVLVQKGEVPPELQVDAQAATDPVVAVIP